MITYHGAATKMNGRDQKKVGNNRWLYRSIHQYRIEPITGEASTVDDGLPAINYRLHNTDVVTIILGDYYILRTGGWYTVTTKAAINEVIPSNLHSESGGWTVGNWGADGYEFKEHMVLDRLGRDVDYVPPSEMVETK